MKLIGMAAILGMAVATAAVGCSTTAGSDFKSGDTSSNIGQVGMQLTLPSGVSLSSVTWTVTNAGAGFTPRSETVNIGNTQSIEFVIGNLPAGAGYTITLNSTDSSGDTCLGTGTFSVIAGAVTDVGVNIVCTVVGDASTADVSTGSVAIDASVTFTTIAGQSCPGITSFAISPAEQPLGAPMALSSAVTGTATYLWSASSPTTGAGTFGNAAAQNTTFTCTAPGLVNIKLTIGGGDGGCANAPYTTIAHAVNCEGTGAAIDAGTPDTGSTADAGSAPVDAGPADTGSTADAGPPAVTCEGNSSGVCTPTELLLKQHSPSCYSCLLAQGCIDDTTFGDTGFECGDVAGSSTGGTARSQLCLNTLSCILSTSCAANGVGNCYCGTAVGTACSQPTGQNGACLAQEQAGLESTDPNTILNNYSTNSSLGGSIANQIFQCASANLSANPLCQACLQ